MLDKLLECGYNISISRFERKKTMKDFQVTPETRDAYKNSKVFNFAFGDPIQKVLQNLIDLVGKEYALNILEREIKHVESIDKEQGLAESHIDPHDYLFNEEYDETMEDKMRTDAYLETK